MDRAHNWDEFRAALKRFWGPPQNCIYADRNGHIAYHAIGGMPIRRGFRGELPLDGSSSKFEWQGYVPFDQLPSYYDPPVGVIASSQPEPISSRFSVPGRRPIRGTRSDPPDPCPASARSDTLPVAEGHAGDSNDYYSALVDRSRPPGSRGIRSQASQRLLFKAAVESVADVKWANGREQSARSLPNCSTQRSRKCWSALPKAGNGARRVSSLPTKASPQAIAAAAQPLQEIQPGPIVIEHLLEQRPQGWVNDWDTLLINAFKTAMNAGRNQLGSPVTGWKWLVVLLEDSASDRRTGPRFEPLF